MIPQDLQSGKDDRPTLLKPDATQQEIAQLCFEARKYGFASVCVNPTWVSLCAQLLQGLGCQGLYGDRFSAWGDIL